VKLDVEQVYWYYKKYEKYLNKDKIKQEYPCDPQEAFIMSGKPVFDSLKLIARKAAAPRPLKIGYFIYDYNNQMISNIRWVNDRNGYIRIYQVPDSPEITKYCIGGDTAGTGIDYFTGHVLDAKTGVQVAKLKHQFDADQYTRQMYCLGKYYKDALIGIEANFDSFPIKELQRLGYPKQYVREAQDTYTHKTEKRFGFKTTSLTRPTIISRLIEIVREHCDTINDRDTLEELLTITRNENGRIEAPEGGHDDDMMGLAIAHEIRDQVVFVNEPIEVKPQYHFNVEKQYDFASDWGEPLTII
jgi:phage terminase large subunit